MKLVQSMSICIAPLRPPVKRSQSPFSPRSRGMAKSSTITREGADAAAECDHARSALLNVARCYRARCFKQSPQLFSRTQHDVGGRVREGVLGNKALQRFLDPVFDLIHHSEAGRTLATQMGVRKHQI